MIEFTEKKQKIIRIFGLSCNSSSLLLAFAITSHSLFLYLFVFFVFFYIDIENHCWHFGYKFSIAVYMCIVMYVCMHIHIYTLLYMNVWVYMLPWSLWLVEEFFLKPNNNVFFQISECQFLSHSWQSAVNSLITIAAVTSKKNAINLNTFPMSSITPSAFVSDWDPHHYKGNIKSVFECSPFL